MGPGPDCATNGASRGSPKRSEGKDSPVGEDKEDKDEDDEEKDEEEEEDPVPATPTTREMTKRMTIRLRPFRTN